MVGIAQCHGVGMEFEKGSRRTVQPGRTGAALAFGLNLASEQLNTEIVHFAGPGILWVWTQEEDT